MMHLQDGFAWGSGSIGLLFLFIILLIVILTWKRCPSCCYDRHHQRSMPETQLAQTSHTTTEETEEQHRAHRQYSTSSACPLVAQGNPRPYMFKCTSYPDIHHKSTQ